MIAYRIFDHMEECSEEEVKRLLPLVSLERRKYALRYKHTFGQYCALKSYVMLTELLGEQREWCYQPQGKPYLTDGPEFSISHCRNAIAVAVADRPIGLDIESPRQVSKSLIEYCMNEAEQALIHQAEDREHAFLRLWTQKEAVAKMLGTGISNDMRDTLSQCTLPYEMHLLADNERYVCHLAIPC